MQAFTLHTLPKTNGSPLKIGRAPKQKQSSNHHFSKATALLGDDISTRDRMHGVAGNPDCWTDVFDYHRCCEPGRRGLFILPSPAKASDAVAAHSDMECLPFPSQIGI